MQCYVPYTTKNGDRVPCGRCINCHKRRASTWVHRLMVQHRHAEVAYFVTLTYNQRCCPHTDDEYDLPTLDRKHVKDYCKRLRQAHARTGCTKPIKYYFVGEYGKSTTRPHYHAIIYNARPDLIESCWTLSVSSSKHDRIKAGTVDVQECNMGTICYVTQYLFKGRSVPAFENDPRQREFANMSHGLGLDYLTPAMVRYHRQDLERTFVNLPGGNKLPMARYYRNKIYSKFARDLQAAKLQVRFELEYRENVKRSGLSPFEYDQQLNQRRMEQMRLLTRRNKLKVWKL